MAALFYARLHGQFWPLGTCSHINEGGKPNTNRVNVMTCAAPRLPEAKEQARLQVIRDLGLSTEMFEDSYDRVVRMVKGMTGVQTCVFSVVEDERQFFKAKEGIAARETPREVAFCAWAIVQDDLNEIFLVEDASQHPQFKDNPLINGAPNIRFYAGIPVLAPNQLPVGTICIIDDQAQELTEGMSQALHDAKGLLEDSLVLQTRSVRDHLTGLYNRMFFDDGLDREWRRAYRYLLPMSIVMVDVDNFKQYNDCYGHVAGDEVLMNVAQALQDKCARAGDLVARYGGEEFVLVLPKTDALGCAAICEDLVQAVRDLNIEHKESERGIVTISAGAAVAHAHEHLRGGGTSLVGMADAALYAAKTRGRNQAHVRVLEIEEQRDPITQTRRSDRPYLARG